ncbi:MAG TPA: hypothetical protein VHX38_22015 [Pseudonocardiaceae bacterium]|nr:hypothetical protein [Pseudonocardiaceae bacterium]
MDEVLFGILAEHVERYLDAVDQLVARADELAAQAAAGTRRLAAAWRALLRLHRPAGRGGCTGCGRRRLPSAAFAPAGLTSAGRRDRGSWCGVWRVASSFFFYQLPLDADQLGSDRFDRNQLDAFSADGIDADGTDLLAERETEPLEAVEPDRPGPAASE